MENYLLKRVWKFLLMLAAVAIGLFSLLYTNKLVSQLASEEEKKIQLWANAYSYVSSETFDGDLSFQLEVIQANTTIPVILTNQNGGIITFTNLDTTKAKNKTWLQDQLEEMNEYISEYGKEKGFDVLFGTEGAGNIMYAKESMNITEKVVEYINDKYQGGKN